MRILAVRNDKLGDFMLAWPAFALLKQQRPDWQVVALVPEYTAPMARLCPWVDEVLIDPGRGSGLGAWLRLWQRLRRERFDAALTLFSTGRIGLALCLARIPYRLAPATKLAQLCYNRRLRQRRSRSLKPEYAYNLDLAAYMLEQLGGEKVTLGEADEEWLPPTLSRPLLRFAADEVAQWRADFCRVNRLPPEAQLVFIHPGSGGSAGNLQPEGYARLARALEGARPLAFVISCGPDEERTAEALAAALSDLPVAVHHPAGGLERLSRHLAFADLFISASTGPLHIAAALDRPTAAFYPRHRSGSPLRWQTLNAADRRLVFTPPEGAGAREVDAIDVEAAAAAISRRFLD
jgi:ADP-heptose:LPS heptosyltransferase